MSEVFEVKMSPLCQPVERAGKAVQVDIYQDGESGWILEVVDEMNNSVLWDGSFPSDEAALKAALDAIEEEGIDAFIGSE